MNRKQLLGIMAASTAAVVVSTYALAQSGWVVSKNPPTTIGQKVASGSHSSANPDVQWQANTGGLLQVVSFDNDAKCGETGHVFTLNTDVYPIPTAPGPCQNPQDGLYASNTFGMNSGDVAKGETNDDSGTITFNFATHTPTPEIPTEVPTETPTPTATFTPSPTPTPTNTPIPTEVLPPNEATACLSVWTVPDLPDAIPAEGYVVDIYVDAVNPQGYTLYDGTGYLYFDTQPLLGITILPNRAYTVDVGNADATCTIGAVPTNLIEEEQPVLYQEYVYMPVVNR